MQVPYAVPMSEPLDLNDPGLIALLRETKAMTLATVGEGAMPACATVYVSKSPHCFDFVSKADSEHSQNLISQPTASASIYREGEGLSDIVGLQMKGRVTRLEGDVDRVARGAYLTTFPEIEGNPPLLMMFQSLPMYRFEPHWMRYIDHHRGLPRRREWAGG